MTTTNTDAARDRFDRIVAALTEAARADVDVADFLAHVASAVAANVGGIEQLLAGRSGSWEADLVRQLVAGTVGWDEQYLHEYRTEPVVVRVHVEDILTDLGVAGLFEQAQDELDRRDNAVWARHAMTNDPDANAEAEFAAIDRIRDQLNALQDTEWAAYGQAFADQVRNAASELFPGLTVPVEVVVATDWQPDSDSGSGDGPEWRLYETARQRTPLPGSGLPLSDYPPGVDMAEAIRAAGRDPLTRLTTGNATTEAGE